MSKKLIENLIDEGLEEKLGQLNLAKSGNKIKLQDRLLEHYGYSTPDDNGSECGLLNVLKKNWVSFIQQKVEIKGNSRPVSLNIIVILNLMTTHPIMRKHHQHHWAWHNLLYSEENSRLGLEFQG